MNVKYSIECLPEDLPVRGNALASGDPMLDRETEDSIIADLERGNEWAWCCVKVTAEIDGFTGSDYLGGCSYENEYAFKQGAYFEDMKRAALADLGRNLHEAVRAGDHAAFLLSESLSETAP